MIADNQLSKVDILLQQKKYAAAERIIKDLLTEDSGNIQYLSLLAEVNLQQDKFDIARNIIENAIGQAPDSAHLFFMKTRILIQQDDFKGAEENIIHAITLDPYDADYFALLGNIKLGRKKYSEALEFADKALEIDAENLLALNTRSTALLKLNRSEESFDTIEGALREDPNSAYTHANYGWGLLEKGDHKKALEHFKESLKNDPNFNYAQSGMLEALKATNLIYRLFLKYAFFMGNLTAKYKWAVIVGFYLVAQFLKGIARTNEAARPYLIPVLIGLALIAFSTWIISPISNLFLRFNKYGQLLLDKKEKLSSSFVAVALFTLVAGVVLYFALSDQRYLTLTVFGFAMMLPLSVMFSPSKGKYSLLIYAIAMAAVGISAIAITFSTGELFNTMSLIFVIGFIAFQWVANFLLMEGDR